ncbi:MAG: hypothetical protein Sw1PiTSA_00540 [Shewanella algae]
MKWISTTTWIGLAVTLLFLCLTPVIIDEVLIREMGMSQSGAEKLQLLFLSAFIVLCLCLFTFRRYQKLTLTMAIIASLPFIPWSIFFLDGLGNDMKRYRFRNLQKSDPEKVKQHHTVFKYADITGGTAIMMAIGVLMMGFGSAVGGFMAFAALFAMIKYQIKKSGYLFAIVNEGISFSPDSSGKQFYLLPLDKITLGYQDSSKLTLKVRDEQGVSHELRILYGMIDKSQRDEAQQQLQACLEPRGSKAPTQAESL